MIAKRGPYYLFLILTIGSIPTYAKDSGEKLYKEGKFKESQEFYIQESMKRGAEPEIQFGYGAAAYQLENLDDAIHAFESVSRSDDPKLSSKAYFNLGNTLYKKQEMERSLEAYKRSLELDPGDMDAKANFEMVRRQMEKNSQNNQDENQQDQQKDQQQNQDQNQQDQSQQGDQQKQSQDGEEKKQDQNKDQADQNSGDQQDKDNKKDKSNEQESQPGQEAQEKQSPEKRNAEAILNSLKKDEKINQKRQIARVKSRTMEKDW